MNAPPPRRPPHRLAGVAWILAASAAFAAMAALTKVALRGTGVGSVIFWRSLVITLAVGVVLWRRGTPLRPGRPRLMLWRCVIGFTGMVAYFWSIGEIPLGTAATLTYAHPIHTVVLAGPLLGERLPRSAFAFALLGFVGIALIVRPGDVPIEAGSVVGFAGSVAVALAYVTLRQLRKSDPTTRIVWWFAAFSTILCAPFVGLDGLPGSALEWLALLGVGLCAGAGQLMLTEAYQLEEANVLAPYSYSTVVISFVIGLALFDEVLAPAAIAGMALVIASGIAVSRRAAARAPEVVRGSVSGGGPSGGSPG